MSHIDAQHQLITLLHEASNCVGDAVVLVTGMRDAALDNYSEEVVLAIDVLMTRTRYVAEKLHCSGDVTFVPGYSKDRRMR